MENITGINVGPATRLFAAGIAAVAWLGLGVQFVDTHHAHSAAATLWIILAYFTITTNLLVALLFTGIAIAPALFRSASLLAGAMLSILLVGAVKALLLPDSIELSAGSAMADKLLHIATPLLVPLFWIVAAPKGRLRWRDPLLWTLYPLAYLGYALVRGAATHKYPYPFLNVLHLGWQRTSLNVLLISLAFIASAAAIVWLDGRLASQHVSKARAA